MFKKFVKYGFICLAVFLLIGYFVVLFGLAPIVNRTAEKFAPEILGCSVTIEDIDVSPVFNGSTVRGIKVGNPQGFKTETAFQLDNISVKVSLGSLLSDTIVVKHVIIDGAKVTYEQGLSTSNLFAIKNNIEKYAEGLSKENTEKPVKVELPEDRNDGASKRLIIEKFVFKNAKVDFSAVFMGGKSVTLPIPNIELTDIGKTGESGATISEVVKEVYNEIFTACTKVASSVGKGLEKAGGAVLDSAKGLKSEAEGLLKGAGSIFGFGGSKGESEEK